MKTFSYIRLHGTAQIFQRMIQAFPVQPFYTVEPCKFCIKFRYDLPFKTCTVRWFRVNEMRRRASFCPFICPDLFKLNVILNFFKLSPTLSVIASKIVAIQHTHRRCLFLSTQYSTLSSQNNSLLLSPIVLLFYYQSRGFQLRFQFQSSGLSGSHV